MKPVAFLTPLSGLFFLAATAASLTASAADIELIESRKIWDAAPHNAFTDLAHFRGRWFCVFREGQSHVSPNGRIRVLSSSDGKDWASAALLEHPLADLRDPKIVVTPDQELMLTAAAAWHQPAPHTHQSLAWFSREGKDWSQPIEIGDPDVWLWRVSWANSKAYGVGYDTKGEAFVRLYTSDRGRQFHSLVPTLFSDGRPNETALVFLPDETGLCLLRCDGQPGTGKLGISKPPYSAWEWKDLGVKIGGPNMFRLPDGRLLAAVRLYDKTVRTSLAWIDRAKGSLTECLALPSGGDCSYAGLVLDGNILWVSYYSSHEGKTGIYLAKARLD